MVKQNRFQTLLNLCAIEGLVWYTLIITSIIQEMKETGIQIFSDMNLFMSWNQRLRKNGDVYKIWGHNCIYYSHKCEMSGPPSPLIKMWCLYGYSDISLLFTLHLKTWHHKGTSCSMTFQSKHSRITSGWNFSCVSRQDWCRHCKTQRDSSNTLQQHLKIEWVHIRPYLCNNLQVALWISQLK